MSANLGHLLYFVLAFLFLLSPGGAFAQDRLKTMPGYARYQKISRESTNAFKSGALSVTWKEEGKSFEFQKDGKRFSYDFAARKATGLSPPPTNAPAARAQARSQRRSRPSAP